MTEAHGEFAPLDETHYVGDGCVPAHTLPSDPCKRPLGEPHLAWCPLTTLGLGERPSWRHRLALMSFAWVLVDLVHANDVEAIAVGDWFIRRARAAFLRSLWADHALEVA